MTALAHVLLGVGALLLIFCLAGLVGFGFVALLDHLGIIAIPLLGIALFALGFALNGFTLN